MNYDLFSLDTSDAAKLTVLSMGLGQDSTALLYKYAYDAEFRKHYAPNDFLVISGDDFTALPTVLAGGSGVISVLGQGLPAGFSKMIKQGLQGKSEEAYELHHGLLPAMQLIFEEGNPAGIKSIFESLGLCSAVVRLPLVEASLGLKNRITAYLKSHNKVHA